MYKGFTLIELLVVIAIIGLLSSVVLASLESSRERAEDISHIAALKQFQIAVELCFDKRGTYNLAETTLPQCYRSQFTDGDFVNSWNTNCSEFLPLPDLDGRGAFATYHTGNGGRDYVILYDIPHNNGNMTVAERDAVIANSVGSGWSACTAHDYAIGS